MSATGDSDTRNTYDMIAARQGLDLRLQLERLDGLLLRSAGVDPASLRFSFRPLWQLTAPERAAVALQKAQTTAVYAGLNLWPAAVTAGLVRSQLLEDGTYPGAAAAFGAGEDLVPASQPVADFDPDQARASNGRWTSGGGAGAGAGAPTAEPAGKPSTAPLAQRGSGGSGTLGSIRNLPNPISNTAAKAAHPPCL